MLVERFRYGLMVWRARRFAAKHAPMLMSLLRHRLGRPLYRGEAEDCVTQLMKSMKAGNAAQNLARLQTDPEGTMRRFFAEAYVDKYALMTDDGPEAP